MPTPLRIIIGFIAGAVARFLMPGKAPVIMRRTE
jgi:uncharacterized membrane protein YeaQ/YmgE (transglycosylase-associated protein family)